MSLEYEPSSEPQCRLSLRAGRLLGPRREGKRDVDAPHGMQATPQIPHSLCPLSLIPSLSRSLSLSLSTQCERCTWYATLSLSTLSHSLLLSLSLSLSRARSLPLSLNTMWTLHMVWDPYSKSLYLSLSSFSFSLSLSRSLALSLSRSLSLSLFLSLTLSRETQCGRSTWFATHTPNTLKPNREALDHKPPAAATNPHPTPQTLNPRWCWVQGSGFRVQGSGFRVQGLGFRVQGSRCRVQGSGFKVQGSGFRVQGSGLQAHLGRRNTSGSLSPIW